ncbi:hypothetical protein MTR67_025668 [Solanum verrucosum]|uniref:Uncharacterized protein n=1 Tax=Solanum verrucosum TaxID=315347 RepID=A0AAF0R192_SOLVR|nr:hypothetical protein MTR67_025668 [Solanum verrucosum]
MVLKVSLYKPSLDTDGPTSYLTNDSIDVGEAVDLGGEGEAVNLSGESVDVNLGEEGEAVNLSGDGGEDVDDNLGGEELLNKKQKTKNRGKILLKYEEIPIGEAGGIDRGFEDIGKNKTNKYAGKLGGDEDYLVSSDYWSDDSDEPPDVNDVRGVDIPARRRSKKVRYDEDCEVSIIELGIVFKGANQFRKAVLNYSIDCMIELHLKHR